MKNKNIDYNKNHSISLKERVLGVLKYHSIKQDGLIIPEDMWNELSDNLIHCIKNYN